MKGAESTGAAAERFDLFRLEKYTGCISCFGCKKEKNKGRCICRDGLTPVLDAIREADGLIIGSPNYLGEMTASFRALYERLIFQNLTYNAETPCCNQNILSVVFDDLTAARETQNRIRAFIRRHPTVYCGTHTPQGYENLEAKRVMDLDHPVPTVFAEVDFSKQEASGKYVCSICGYVYDPAEHDGVAFEDLPDDWKCPRCKQGKEKFNKA